MWHVFARYLRNIVFIFQVHLASTCQVWLAGQAAFLSTSWGVPSTHVGHVISAQT